MECPVCYEDISPNEKRTVATLGCGHAFCGQCIYQLLEKNDKCPICRFQVIDIKKLDNEKEDTYLEEDDEDEDEDDDDEDDEEDDGTIVEEVQHFITDSYEDYSLPSIPNVEDIYNYIIANGYTGLDIFVSFCSAVKMQSGMERYDSVRKRNNLAVSIVNIMKEYDNAIIETYLMSEEDTNVNYYVTTSVPL